MTVRGAGRGRSPFLGNCRFVAILGDGDKGSTEHGIEPVKLALAVELATDQLAGFAHADKGKILKARLKPETYLPS